MLRRGLPARQDDIEIYPEFGTDLERLLTDAPTGSSLSTMGLEGSSRAFPKNVFHVLLLGWSALQMSSVSTKAADDTTQQNKCADRLSMNMWLCVLIQDDLPFILRFAANI